MLPEIYRNNPVVRHSFEFSMLIDAYCTELKSGKKFEIANQLFRSGTSIGANIWEAQEAESKADFIHKMKIAAKEAHETYYWLLLCNHSPSSPDAQPLIIKLTEIRKLISAIIHSSKQPNRTT